MDPVDKKGIVYLVGAGPGDPELFTLKGQRLLHECEVLIYDNLVSPGIIAMASHDCEKIYVGKSGSMHTLEQDQINSLIVKKALEGKKVVRLKGGDPFIFGRGGEEAEVLNDNNIRFEVVCGISSAYSAPAYAGIPVTHRGLSSSVAFITGHEDPTKDESDINWNEIATASQTLVFLMGVKNLPIIAEKLTSNGLPPETPAAVIMNGTYPSQKTVTGTLDTIADDAAAADIKPPSIIVVGRTANMREKLNWFETAPLFGKRIIVTRSRSQASALTKKLTAHGAEVIEVPAIKIVPAGDDTEFIEAISNLQQYDWIILTSVNGVYHFFEKLNKEGKDSRSLAGINFCTIGPATSDELKKHGIIPDLMPEKFIHTAIVEALEKKDQISDKNFLMARADIAPEALQKELFKRGASRVDDVKVYRTLESGFEVDETTEKILSNEKVDLVTFTSSSTAVNFKKILSSLNLNPVSFKCAAIGPITAEKARQEGFAVETVSEVYTIDGLVQSIISYLNS